MDGYELSHLAMELRRRERESMNTKRAPDKAEK
jgi:hypothetical protein